MKATLCATLVAVVVTLPAVSVASPQTAPPSASSTGHAADNTAVNARDRSGDTPTSSSQSNDASDVKLAAAVRRALTKDSSLSMLAHNVKVIASGSTVTLRGPVKSEDEKSRVESIARAVSGVSQVTNELEVKP